jgi:hypothetical protein
MNSNQRAPVSRFLLRMIVMAAALGCAAAPAAAQNVAMVTDVSGKVTGTVEVTILSEIPADARVQLEAKARLVAIYLKSGDEYSFTGPGQVQFQAGEPKVLSGAKLQKRASPLGKGGNITIKPVGVAQAAYVMRSSRTTARIKLLALSGTRTLESPPEFRWQTIEPGVKYRFELTDDTGRSLYESETEATSLKLPASIALREGASYTWEVSTRAPDNRRYVSAGDFSIAPAAVKTQAQALRPPAGAPVSQRVAYAAWLEQMELRDEARRYWRTLSAERPEDAKLKALAAE